jgi:outer membrane murein-binding lipoprotein Lpp
MAASNNLEARVTALETQFQELAEDVRQTKQDVRHIKQDAAAARVLAGRADHGVTEIRAEVRDFRRATTASFNAMREDHIDLRNHVDKGFAEVHSKFDEVYGKFDEVYGKFDEVHSKFDEVYGKFDEVDNGFIAIRGMLDAAAAGQQQIVTLLNTLIGQQG